MPIIQSVERALKILDLFDDHTKELKITTISERMGLHKSTVHSLLKTLQEYRYIEQNPENGQYRLGIKLVERGNLVISSMDLRKLARKHLTILAEKTGQTCHLGVLDGKAGVYIDKEVGEKAVIRYSRVGRRIPLHATAIGKILLAYQKPEKLWDLLDAYEYVQITEKTIRNEEECMTELEKVRDQGYAVDNQENEPGVRCIAVPIINKDQEVLGALSISTLIANVSDQKLDYYIDLLKQTGKTLSEETQYLGV
ncbi:IclR family transcriptional regulator [Oceanobacillus halophilus]|uniref:Glycerol operon regulatory protein n=1 Tax=Oceanobacillus halophilus TaxID=930130 RepID=A0A494ZUZ6_9BACI|nr:IclR family transcriptional regulator [Oceanobacillus halophilus]RKQ30236.1 IclR family transcriptional regulator [Oceanobacillus halophilus]